MDQLLFKNLKARLDNYHGMSRRKYFAVYTAVFAVVTLLVFGIFFVNDKSFVWQSDGWTQHYKALVYYAEWLRSIVKTLLFEHKLEIATYSFSIGYGSDILTTLHYYVIGDPICLLSVFVPTKYMVYFYNAMIIFRLYLAGITFSLYCFYMERKAKDTGTSRGYGKMAILSGTLAYVFCGYALFAAIRHPYFANPMIYLPLILLGVEKILDRKRSFVFILSVFISAVSNFYFFYMIVILTVLYVAWRVLVVYSKAEIKRTLCSLGKITAYSILGTAMSAVILLPTILAFLNSSRTESNYVYDLLYTISDYEGVVGGFLSVTTGNHEWTYMGYGALALIAVFVLFMQKGHRDVKVAFAVLTLMTLLPTAGHIMNGFSYVSNRWIWGYSFFVAYIIVLKWRSLFELTIKQRLILLALLSAYALLCFILVKSRTIGAMFALAVAFLMFSVFSVTSQAAHRRFGYLALTVCLLVNIVGNAFLKYSQRNSSYITEFLANENIVNKLKYTEAVAIKEVSENDDGFFRYSGNSISRNGTLYSGLSSTQYYWSLENGNITIYRNALGLSDSTMGQKYSSLDARTILSTLANVKYYSQSSSSAVLPYGYTLIGAIDNYESVDEYLSKNLSGAYTEADLTEDEIAAVEANISTYYIYENECTLPFGYTYSSYITSEDYETMTPLEKQEAMLQGVVIDSNSGLGEAAELTFTGQTVDYEVEIGSNVTIEDNLITVTAANSTITLTFDGLEAAETYLYITGLSYDGTDPVARYTEFELDLLSTYEQNELLNYTQKYYEDATSLSITVTAKNTERASNSKTLTYYTPKYSWYSNREDFMVNLGYDDNAKVSISIKFPSIGTYSFDSIAVLCQPFDNYADQVAALAEDVLENVDFHNDNAAFATNLVTGTISMETDKYLLLTIPYTDGWTAYVDGKEQEILQANTMYMALYLEAGEHEIILKYRTPGLLAGGILSGCGTGVFCGVVLVNRKRRKETKTDG